MTVAVDAPTLSGLHLLLTYECNYECDHCFVCGGPRQSGTMTLQRIENILLQARSLGTIDWIYFEGGEPFLYYAILLRAIRRATDLGFRVGIVSNGFWATDPVDAVEWLRPLAGKVGDLSISSDPYHGSEMSDRQTEIARGAAASLGIPVEVISIAQPEATSVSCAVGQLPSGESAIMYRGRAALKLAGRAPCRPWEEFTECPYEDLRRPDRLHVDSFGHVHICQGISLGNLFQTPLREIWDSYDPERHPITGPLVRSGPAELVRRYGVAHGNSYADACHLCFETRRALRDRFPDLLAPDQMYDAADK
jgi:MoaA/NifB/PqqE/SkfB family radical SAM enzyme